jgi:hypothetical protein
MPKPGGCFHAPSEQATGPKPQKSPRKENFMLKQMLLIGAAAVSFPALAQTTGPTGEKPAPTDTMAPAPDEKPADDAKPTDGTAPTEDALPTDTPPAAEPNPPVDQPAPEPEPTPEPDPE